MNINCLDNNFKSETCPSYLPLSISSLKLWALNDKNIHTMGQHHSTASNTTSSTAVTKLTDLPQELLVKIFIYDVQHHRKRVRRNEPYIDAVGEYLHSLSIRKVKGIYAAAKEAFWKTHAADVFFYQLGTPGGPRLRVGETCSSEMTKRSRRLYLFVVVESSLDDAGKGQHNKQGLLAFLKGLEFVTQVNATLLWYRDSAADESDVLLLKGVLKQLELDVGRNIKHSVVGEDFRRRDMPMRSK
jgi:hypothetical protein